MPSVSSLPCLPFLRPLPRLSQPRNWRAFGETSNAHVALDEDGHSVVGCVCPLCYSTEHRKQRVWPSGGKGPAWAHPARRWSVPSRSPPHPAPRSARPAPPVPNDAHAHRSQDAHRATTTPRARRRPLRRPLSDRPAKHAAVAGDIHLAASTSRSTCSRIAAMSSSPGSPNSNGST